MAGVHEKLMPFLDKAARRPFEWGVSDCMLELADWLDHACGSRLAEQWRGTYSSEAGAEAIFAPSGGLEPFIRAMAASLGLAEAVEPRFGDMALVTVPGQEKPLGAILMPSGRWRMKTATGVVLTRDVTILAAWALPCRPTPPPPRV